jgi:DNA invertase Pin-like site-specific DNA recombinase
MLFAGNGVKVEMDQKLCHGAHSMWLRFQMCGVFAEFERAMIVERVNSGLARVKAKGVKLGRGNKKDGERSADEERWGMSRGNFLERHLGAHGPSDLRRNP